MGILICIKGKNKVKIFRIGNTVNLLTMAVAVCKSIAEKVAIEKRISLHHAMIFTLECIENTNNHLN